MDVRRLLEGVMGSGMAANLEKEARRMMGGGAGGTPQQTPGGAGGGVGGAAAGFGGGMLGGAAAGGLLTMVLGSKKGRKMGGKALKYGGAALLAGLAYKAWSDWKSGQPAQGSSLNEVTQQPVAQTGFALEQGAAGGEDFRLALVRAMIAAAKCDGHIDSEEHARITSAITGQNLSAEEKGFLLDAFAGEADAMAIARLAKTQEQGAELYVASRLAIDPDVPAEHQYLARLGQALGLPPTLVEHLDAKVESARAEAEAV